MTLRAPYVLEYTYKRSTGPVVGRFLGALKSKQVLGAKTRDGRVLVPPPEYDESGNAIVELVPVSDRGVVTTWSLGPAKPHSLVPSPFAWALIRLDGSHSSVLHMVRAADPSAIRTGMRVRAEWSSERIGSITDITCFVSEA